MTELEGFSYAVFGVYALTSAGLWLAGHRLGVAHGATWLVRVAFATFASAGLWPLLRLYVGDLIVPDPLRLHLDGLTGDLVGHAVLAAGALAAMIAEVQILTRARAIAIAPAEPAMAERVPQLFVAGGRAAQVIGLFLVFPGVVQGVLVIAAASAGACRAIADARTAT